MKILIPLILSACLFSGCVSPPQKKPILSPTPVAIRIASDQKILGHSHTLSEYFLVSAGTYALIGEDKNAWYYANPKEEVRVKNLYPERVENGGIGYWKANGNFFMYLPNGVKDAKRTAMSMGGEFAAFGVKSTLNDGVYRFFYSWVPFDYVSEWKFEETRSNQRLQGTPENVPSSSTEPEARRP